MHVTRIGVARCVINFANTGLLHNTDRNLSFVSATVGFLTFGFAGELTTPPREDEDEEELELELELDEEDEGIVFTAFVTTTVLLDTVLDGEGAGFFSSGFFSSGLGTGRGLDLGGVVCFPTACLAMPLDFTGGVLVAVAVVGDDAEPVKRPVAISKPCTVLDSGFLVCFEEEAEDCILLLGFGC